MALERIEQMRKTVKTDVPVFRERLHTALNAMEISQRKLAAKMGKDARTINHVFTGPVHPDLGTLKEFCSNLNVSADWLLGLTDTQKPNDGEFDVAVKTYAAMEDAYDPLGVPLSVSKCDSRFYKLTGDIVCYKIGNANGNLNNPVIHDEDYLYVDKDVTRIGVPGFYATAIKGQEPAQIWHQYYITGVSTDGQREIRRIYPDGTDAVKMGFDKIKTWEEQEFYKAHQILGRVVYRMSSHLL